ncbi:hypothetical protein GCM10010923_16730 [Blastomonas marina]|uniref:Uncharacterized protein n=1 Tax=Blastomonas marina TaxID=1867408 RepID=A0ABQ1FDR5_9SPHN|nr:hypothetical protein [Blastomonas marina]GGA07338.1 hypothetical protein GCM10010923_16730 [Blastomonas marina]
MFGPDTSLVVDAIQIGLIALGAGIGGTLLFRRYARTNQGAPSPAEPKTQGAGSLEDRVRVLERIATDRPTDLAEQIEALRDGDITSPVTRKETV